MTGATNDEARAGGSRLERALASPWSARRLVVVHAAFALLAFPFLEVALRGAAAPDYAHDAFDDGVSRLGAACAGSVGLWNPNLTCGNAALAQFAIPSVALDVGLARLTSPFAAYTAWHLLVVLVAGVGMHLFLRDSLGLPTAAALFGALTFEAQHWDYCGLAVAAFPLALWLFDRAHLEVGGRARRLPACALLLAVALYHSYAQVLLLGAGLQLAWTLATTARARVARRLLDAALAWGLALALYAPVIATQLVYLPVSHRTLWTPRGADVVDLLLDRATRYSALAFGTPLGDGTLGVSAGGQGTFFVGPLGLALVGVALVTRRRGRPELLVLLGSVAILAVDVGGSLAVAALGERLGFLRSFRFSSIAVFVPMFLAAMVAVGAARLRELDVADLAGRARALMWLTIGVALVAPAVWPAAVAPAEELPRWLRSAGRIYAGLAAVSFLALVALAPRLLRRPGRPALIALLLLAHGAERLVYGRVERATSTGLGSFAGYLGSDASIELLKGRPRLERAVSIGQHPNRLNFHGLQAADGYQVIYPVRYHDVFGLLIEPSFDRLTWLREYFHGWGNRAYVYDERVNRALLDLLGVRWVRSHRRLEQDGLELALAGDGVWLYRNDGAFPRAFLAAEVRAFADRAALLDALGRATSGELRRAALVLESDRPPGEGSATTPVGHVEVASYAPDEVALEVSAARPCLLVLVDTFAPGWVCRVDGAARPIIPAYEAFRAVPVGPRDARVVFSYEPTFTWAGLLVAGGALLALGVWTALLRRSAEPHQDHVLSEQP